jgi:hypothetical protein
LRSPRLVAESLRDVPDVLATALPQCQPADEARFEQLLTAAWQPARSTATPPSFLRPTQVDPWRRAIAALEGWRIALVAEPVGTGKTWIALAVAAHWPGRCTVIGPAALATQWRRVAGQAGVTAQFHSLERLSRGRLPPAAPLVIIDEAHRLRHLDTHRVRTLAPWLPGRRVVMLTATPIVNRRRDLLSLLALTLPDDALALDGIDSLRGLASRGVPPPALRRLVIRSGTAGVAHPARIRRLTLTRAERQRTDAVVARVERLRLSTQPGVRRLLATVLLDAGASSDAAWHAALRRYRALLLQSRDAGGVSRAALRCFAGPGLEQIVLWPLLHDLDRHAPPPLDDLDEVERLLRLPRHDAGWTGPLRELLADGRATVCFSRHRDTAAALVEALGEGTAWVTGSAAGIGPHRMTRESVLGAFGPGRPTWRDRRSLPTVLVATEVLAEGLDLQGASRVVHVDLPWHAARLEQRTGRVRRAGQLAPQVEIVHRSIAAAIERRLGLRHRVRRTRSVAQRWLAALETPPPSVPVPGHGIWVAATHGTPGPLALAWVALAAGHRTGCVAVAVNHHGEATPPGSDAAPRHLDTPSSGELHRAARLACRAVRHALGTRSVRPSGTARLIARILSLAHSAAIRRERTTLGRLDDLLAVASRPVPHGIAITIDRLAAGPDRELTGTRISRLPPRDPVTVQWVGLLLYRAGSSPLP